MWFLAQTPLAFRLPACIEEGQPHLDTITTVDRLEGRAGGGYAEASNCDPDHPMLALLLFHAC